MYVYNINITNININTDTDINIGLYFKNYCRKRARRTRRFRS